MRSTKVCLKWDKILKSRLSKFCGRQPLNNVTGYGLLTLSQVCFFFFAICSAVVYSWVRGRRRKVKQIVAIDSCHFKNISKNRKKELQLKKKCIPVLFVSSARVDIYITNVVNPFPLQSPALLLRQNVILDLRYDQ